ncbi:MAG: 2-oxoglutarate dehydrogenase E1 component [Candidatus Dasytiphilus stammeri]
MHENNTLKYWLDTSWITSINQLWIEELYDKFINDPKSIDDKWRFIFQEFTNTSFSQPHFTQTYSKKKTTALNILKHIKVVQLIEAFRSFGHNNANLDPLGLCTKSSFPDLDLSFYGFTQTDLNSTINFDINSGYFSNNQNEISLLKLYEIMRKVYCSSIGVEYMHISNVDEKRWIQHYIESVQGNFIFSTLEKKTFLQDLIAAEELEHYLGRKFPGAKRFSLEGGDVLIPMLKEIIRYSAQNNVTDIILGMAHRGRLNVLINVFGKKTQELLDEFSGKYKLLSGMTGDVKYHMGYASNFVSQLGRVYLQLAFNPSHLEIVNPVVMGSVRAKLDHYRLTEPKTNKVLPITIHGDAAVIAQGVMQETLNLSEVRGYETGGSVRIVINNQIGFTTSNLNDARSTQYCTDIGKMIQVPIFHVNCDDIEAVIFVTRLALDFRNRFKRDVFIDLVCYRRHGHNEADEPSVTQPIMYKTIKKHPSSRQLYLNQLIQKKVISENECQYMTNEYCNVLLQGTCVVKEVEQNLSNLNHHKNFCLDEKYSWPIEIQQLQKLASIISYIPPSVKMQSLVSKIYRDRMEMAIGNKKLDWGSAEILSYATLLNNGISIRLSGEDICRGTFFHRHAVIYNQINGCTYIPLQHIHEKQGIFQIWDSVLSELAVLAFEYGYATTTNKPTLTIWEAQFGDFANGAQVVIDQFISSGEKKWGVKCNLVLLLPHGYEGQGPEHSSARLERYLQLCAENNMQVCVPSTPAQIYNLLRRQALSCIKIPLIIISPKSLLRHHLATSTMNELANGVFQCILGESDQINLLEVKRIIFCSGKIYYELLEQRRKNRQTDIMVLRIEQLYPFPNEMLKNMLQDYSHVKDFIWCQEEPMNQGAWSYIQPYILSVLPSGACLHYAGRMAAASTAVGHISVHQKQQQTIINNALNI